MGRRLNLLCSSLLVLGGVSFFAASCLAVHAGMDADMVSVSAFGVDRTTVDANYDYYFDTIRADTVNGWNRLSRLNMLYDYDVKSLAFTVYTDMFTDGHIIYNDRTYMYRFCSDELGYVYLYEHIYTPNTFEHYDCDFAVHWQYFVDQDDNYLWTAELFTGDTYITVRNSFYGDMKFSCVNGGQSLNGWTASRSFSNVTSNVVLCQEVRDSYLDFSPIYFKMAGRWSFTYMDTVTDNVDYSEGYSEGYHDGYNAGVSYGWSGGYGVGYDSGYSDGLNEGGGVMFNVWPLAAQVVTMPINFIMGGLDWELFSGTNYAFNVATFAGSIFILLMLVRVISFVFKLVGK